MREEVQEVVEKGELGEFWGEKLDNEAKCPSLKWKWSGVHSSVFDVRLWRLICCSHDHWDTQRLSATSGQFRKHLCSFFPPLYVCYRSSPTGAVVGPDVQHWEVWRRVCRRWSVVGSFLPSFLLSFLPFLFPSPFLLHKPKEKSALATLAHYNLKARPNQISALTIVTSVSLSIMLT